MTTGNPSPDAGYNQEPGEAFDLVEALRVEALEREEAELLSAIARDAAEAETFAEARVRITWTSDTVLSLPLDWMDGDALPMDMLAQLAPPGFVFQSAERVLWSSMDV